MLDHQGVEIQGLLEETRYFQLQTATGVVVEEFDTNGALGGSGGGGGEENTQGETYAGGRGTAGQGYGTGQRTSDVGLYCGGGGGAGAVGGKAQIWNWTMVEVAGR